MYIVKNIITKIRYLAPSQLVEKGEDKGI